ncbi:MAG: hypothetical protein Q7T71_10620 [Herbiconiux sp.]|nr:hypothetical protein [Herbiconiux sp.]
MSSAEERTRDELHRSVVIWVGLLLLTLAALFAAIGILNRELYSAPSFVRLYLEAMQRHDVAAALATPGVELTTDDRPGSGEASLLTPDALGTLSELSLVSDTEIVPGRHRIVYSYRLTGASERSTVAQTEFDVVQTGSSWLLFPEWRFVRSPTAHATVTVSHSDSFTAGSTQVVVDGDDTFHANRQYEVLVPSVFVLSHDSDYLGARASTLSVTTVRSTVSAIVDVRPTTAFLELVQGTVDGFLDDCAAQKLLYPPGCPFGLDVNDRIASEPAWSIEAYPSLTILAGQESWVVPSAAGSARIRVDIRSLFDGTVSTRDESVPFDVSFALSIEPDGSIAFAPRA